MADDDPWPRYFVERQVYDQIAAQDPFPNPETSAMMARFQATRLASLRAETSAMMARFQATRLATLRATEALHPTFDERYQQWKARYQTHLEWQELFNRPAGPGPGRSPG